MNLAQSYLKLQNNDRVLRNCNDAIALDATNAKALFRRATAYQNMKEWEKALADLKIAKESSPDDMAIPKAEAACKTAIQKEKDNDKKMWGKAFQS